jgi:septum formation protein
MLKLVLASASPRRKELLKQIGIAFEAVSADIDESPRGFTDASDYVVEMARQKALLVAKRLNTQGETQSFVLGADTTVVIDGEILGKPSDYEDAFAMIRRIQGKWHEVITGIALVDAKTLTPIVDKECTRVKIRAMTDGMIEAYLATV